MLAMPHDLIFKEEIQVLMPFKRSVSEQLENSRYWHIYSKQYQFNGWTEVNRCVVTTPIEELQVSDNEYPLILREIVPIGLPNLLSLSLINNQLASIEALVSLRSPQLQKLHLSRNYIRRISPLRKADLPYLNLLVLNDNAIVDCQSLCQAKFRLQFIVFENWPDSNPICQEQSFLFKFESPKLKYLGMKSVLRIKRSILLDYVSAKYGNIEIKRS